MLLGQHLGGREQRGLAARVDHLEHRPDRDDGLARPDLALQQPVHGVVAGQVGADDRAHLTLARGQRKREPGVEGAGEPAGARRARAGGQRRGGPAALGQDRLQDERLVPLQALLGPVDVRVVGGPVDAAQRVREADQAVPFPQRRGQWVIDVAQGVQQDPDALLDVPGGDVLGGRVHRDQFGRVLGGQRRVIGAEQLELRVSELPLALEGGYPPGEHAVPARGELPLEHLHPVEERQHQARPAVGDRHLEHLAAPLPHPPRRDPGHLGEDGHVLSVTQCGQVGKLTALGVAARVVPQQVARGAQAERLIQLFGGLAPKDIPQRFVQARHGPSE